MPRKGCLLQTTPALCALVTRSLQVPPLLSYPQWPSLGRNLPFAPDASVFVCVDEERLDVMKAALYILHVVSVDSTMLTLALVTPVLQAIITGPAGTPYAFGLFEFDVFATHEYPQHPPMVHLCTTGQGTFRFNPNLYSDGKVPTPPSPGSIPLPSSPQL